MITVGDRGRERERGRVESCGIATARQVQAKPGGVIELSQPNAR